MSLTFEEKFYAAICEWLNGRNSGKYGYGGEVIEAQQVTYVDQVVETSGYCETCWYDEIVLRISYIETGTGKSREYTYYGGMASLISELN